MEMMRCVEHVAHMGEETLAYWVLVRKCEERRPLGTPKHRWVDNTKVDHKEIDYGGVDWTNLAEYSDKHQIVVIMVINLPVHKMQEVS